MSGPIFFGQRPDSSELAREYENDIQELAEDVPNVGGNVHHSISDVRDYVGSVNEDMAHNGTRRLHRTFRSFDLVELSARIEAEKKRVRFVELEMTGDQHVGDGRYHGHPQHRRERPGHDYGQDVVTAQGVQPHHKTSYAETMMHLFKGNIGTGCYAMGDAFKNGGLLLATLLTVLLGFVCVHCQHVLLNCANLMERRRREKQQQDQDQDRATPPGLAVIPAEPPIAARPPDFADTVGLCFEYGPPAVRGWAPTMRAAVNIFICVAQLGSCCIYFVFISSNFKQILDRYGVVLDVHVLMAMLLLPIILTSLIFKLKILSYCSLAANVFMTLGIGITFYYALVDLPSTPSLFVDRHFVGHLDQLPLFFGTAIFAFEGIALVLPLQNEMQNPADFGKPCGVLNLGMIFIVTLFTAFGFVGYLCWGEAVEGSMTLNLPDNEILAESAKVLIACGVLLGYPLQLYVIITIMWPMVVSRVAIARRHPIRCEVAFRVLMVLVTFLIAECVPNMSLFISLIGALCSSALALIFPPVIELIVAYSEPETGFEPGRPVSRWLLIKNATILLLALLGFVTGTLESIANIIQEI